MAKVRPPEINNRAEKTRPRLSTSLSRGKASPVNRRSSSSLRASWQSDEKNKRRISAIGRNHFLRSFGRDTLYRYQGIDDVLHKENDIFSIYLQTPNLIDSIQEHQQNKTVENVENNTDAEKAISTRVITSKHDTLYHDVLSVRGKEYASFGGEINGQILKEEIRSKSAKRRIRRILQAGKAEREETASKLKKEQQQTKRKVTLKGTAISLMAFKANIGTFDMFKEKKKWLTETRIMRAKLVSGLISFSSQH